MIYIYERRDGYFRIIRDDDPNADIHPEIFKPAYKSQIEEMVKMKKAVLAPYIEYVPTYREKRAKSLAEGGRGTIQEQLEMMEEKGVEAWKTHCKSVKTKHPKPTK